MDEFLVRLLWLGHLAVTLLMVGLIWFVQVVHYPLFSSVGSADFPAYERRHQTLTTYVVVPPMILEVATGLLLFWIRPASVPFWPIGIGFLLLIAIWMSTFLLQVPCHNLLSRAFDAKIQKRLMATNWIRTTAWSFRGLLILGMT